MLHGQSTSDFGPPYSALIKFTKFSTPSTYAAENLRAEVIQVLSICSTYKLVILLDIIGKTYMLFNEVRKKIPRSMSKAMARYLDEQI